MGAVKNIGNWTSEIWSIFSKITCYILTLFKGHLPLWFSIKRSLPTFQFCFIFNQKHILWANKCQHRAQCIEKHIAKWKIRGPPFHQNRKGEFLLNRIFSFDPGLKGLMFFSHYNIPVVPSHWSLWRAIGQIFEHWKCFWVPFWIFIYFFTISSIFLTFWPLEFPASNSSEMRPFPFGPPKLALHFLWAAPTHFDQLPTDSEQKFNF